MDSLFQINIKNELILFLQVLGHGEHILFHEYKLLQRLSAWRNLVLRLPALEKKRN